MAAPIRETKWRYRGVRIPYANLHETRTDASEGHNPAAAGHRAVGPGLSRLSHEMKPPPPVATPVARLALTGSALIGGVYLAHLMGLFTVPFVAVGFVAAGIAVRMLLSTTRDARNRGTAAEEARARVGVPAALQLPAFVVMVAIVVALGLILARLIGPH